MNILILGGGGFLGRKLAAALAARGTLCGQAIKRLVQADLTAPAPMKAPFETIGVALDIANSAAVARLFRDRFDAIYHLAAVVSGQAEAQFDIGMATNVTGAINIFEAARAAPNAPVLVFTSSIVAFGGEAPDVIEDDTLLNPQTSYGAQKAVAELLLNDYSRRGYFDGRGVRLPTISVRPGAPNKAASSFMSSIFREPLQGQNAICPVSEDHVQFVLSPRRCIENLIHAAEVPAAAWGQNRCVTLPGRTHTIGEMITAMRNVAGSAPIERIRWEPDPQIEQFVGGWRARFDTKKALELGFVRDESFEDNIRYFLEDDVVEAAI